MFVSLCSRKCEKFFGVFSLNNNNINNNNTNNNNNSNDDGRDNI